MHDEACTHYDDMMNNMMIGHEFLKKEFDYIPTIGWHVDPFGHSNANPRLFADMGFDAWIFGRIDYEDRDKRLKEKAMEWIWKPFSKSLGDQVEIFTHVMQDMYWYPDGFSYDEREYDSDDPVVADESLETFNADQRSKQLRDYILDMKGHYLGNHLMIPWGEDFAYGNAHMNFASYDQLIPYFNGVYDDITIMYSTPYMYVDAIKKQNLTYPTKYDDMFPYADQKNEYWSGYFSSRANSKRQVRLAQANLHASNKVFSNKIINQKTEDSEIKSIQDAKDAMLDAMGIYQHHDAVTGTAKQAVADYYYKHTESAMKKSNEIYKNIIGEFARNDGLESNDWDMCSGEDTYADCPVHHTKEGWFGVTAHNPSSIA